ncbi:6-phospho-beta-galactosidase [Ligilactobacillus acidipiscis]|uniref:6-phospho-beta-galactosidase n=1 Tax=Ligilactobacillus acidipiscis TaxID=89059 RepID=UPI00386C4299
MIMKFQTDFYFGGATAAFQTEGAVKEGNKGEVLWEPYLKKQGRFDPEPACDFFHRYPEDLKLSADFGLNSIRISIAWTRIFPTGSGKPEQAGIAYYHKMFAECRKNGIEPFVTLHHFDTPETLHQTGDWLNEENITKFVDYAKFCFQEFNEINYWITINEPTSMAVQQYTTGTFPPGEKYNFHKTFQAEHNLNLAHARVVNAFRELNINGQIGVVHALQTVYPFDPTNKGDQHAAKLQDVLDNRLFLDGTLGGEYSQETLDLMNEILAANQQEQIKITASEIEELKKAADQLDFVGVNYYFSKYMKEYHGISETIHNGTGKKGSSISRLQGVGESGVPDGIEMTDWDWPINPQGLYDQLDRIHTNYPKIQDIYITENGLGLKEERAAAGEILDDQKRIDYIRLHLQEVLRAINNGINVKGYFVWSLQDMFSWTNGYSKRYGLFFVDFETQERLPKKSAYWFKELTASHELK